jgi:hypothetical protein
LKRLTKPSGYSGASHEDLFADDAVRYPLHCDSFHFDAETRLEAGFSITLKPAFQPNSQGIAVLKA